MHVKTRRVELNAEQFDIISVFMISSTARIRNLQVILRVNAFTPTHKELTFIIPNKAAKFLRKNVITDSFEQTYYFNLILGPN